MSLEKGFIPAWRSDDDLYSDTDEYAIFHFLLKQAHYKTTPYLTSVIGSIGKKHEPYSKEWSIELGDVFTSKSKIAEKLAMYRGTVQKKLLILEKKYLISILLNEPCLIIRIPDYLYFTAIFEKEEDRTPSCSLESRPVKEVGVTDLIQGGVLNNTGGCIKQYRGVTDLIQGGVLNNTQCNPYPNPEFNNQSNNHPDPPLTPQGEIANGSGILLDNLISMDQGKGKLSSPESIPSENRKKILPVVPKKKSITRYSLLNKTSKIDLVEFCTASHCVCGKDVCEAIPF